MKSLLADKTLGNIGQWQERHDAAVAAPTGEERAILDLVKAWARYAETHQRKYEALVGEDGYTGEYWEDIGSALVKMLSADHGSRLDNGTLDKFLRATADQHGVSGDSL